jgi:hypothetical protein
MVSSTGDADVDAALAELADADPDAAKAARTGFESLTWGQGLTAVTAHGLADFLWYQLPSKWSCDLTDKVGIAEALGDLFARVERPRYAAMCRSPVTAEILTAYEQQGEVAGRKAYRQALSATGVEPPDIPGVLAWGRVMGVDEANAYHGASTVLERAIDAGEFMPGVRGWRTTARQVTRRYLDSLHDDVTNTTRLQWLQTERLQRWTESRGSARGRLAGRLGDQLTSPVPAPSDAGPHLAPLRWLLDHAAGGVPLTRTGNLTRAVVADGCRRFGWPTTGNPRSENDVVEVRTVRELSRQLGVVRRSGQRLLLSPHGRVLRRAGTDDLWQAVMAALPGPRDGEAAAAEIALMLMLTGPPPDRELDPTVARVLAEEGWRDRRTGRALAPEQATALLRPLRQRLQVFGLVSGRPPAGEARLDDAGRAAAHAALRTRALRPRIG